MSQIQLNGIEITDYQGTGFQTLIQFGSWRIAAASPGKDPAGQPVSHLSRHLETDEVFILLQGKCTLFAGGNGNQAADIIKIPMEPLKLYNIRKGTWHNRILFPGSLVLIVENAGTGSSNSESLALDTELVP